MSASRAKKKKKKAPEAQKREADDDVWERRGEKRANLPSLAGVKMFRLNEMARAVQ